MNKLLISIFIVITSFSTVVYAQDNPSTRSAALALNLEWGPVFENGTAKTKASYLDALNTALALVKGSQPAGDNLFNWTGNRTVL